MSGAISGMHTSFSGMRCSAPEAPQPNSHILYRPLTGPQKKE